MSRRSRFVLVALLALAAGAGGVSLLLRRDGAADHPAEASRNHFLSIIVFPITEKRPGATTRNLAQAAYDQVRAGTPFEDVARARSEDEASRMMGGLLGQVEVQMEQMTAFQGAAQVLDEGEVKGPLFDGSAWLVMKRHTYDEGRELERKWLLPYFGFRVGHRDIPGGGPDRSREEARAQANAALAELRAGRMDMTQARARFGEPDDRPVNGWLDLLRLTPRNEPVYRVLASVPAGGFPEPLEAENGFLVMRRGPFFRSVVRNILVQHLESEGRPLKEKKTKAQARAHAEEALQRVLADLGRWDELVRAYSDELATLEDRGYIGCLAPGSLPPSMSALEEAILATPPGKVHPKVVETPVGFHVVWRVD